MAGSQTVYDPINHEVLQWRPLSDMSTNTVMRGLGDQVILEVNALGTCGDPRDPEYHSYRTDTLVPVLGRYGLEDRWFNPEVPQWTPLRAPVEGVHTARAAVNIIVVTNQTDSPSGIMEAGMVAYGGVLRGQEVMVSIQYDKDSPAKTLFGRKLAKDALRMASIQYPLFTLEDDAELLAHQASSTLRAKIMQAASGIHPQTQYSLPPLRTDLLPEIYLSGTSGSKKPRWIKRIKDVMAPFDVPVDDSYRVDFDVMASDEEFVSKMGKAVQLIAITSQAESLAALAELGPRMLLGDLQGQSLGVYIEAHRDSSPSSPANRTRTLALEHLNRLRDDFPRLPIFVANTLEELAIYGLSEHFRQKQRLERSS